MSTRYLVSIHDYIWYMHFIICDRTWVVWWSSIQHVGTFGLARGRQLKSFWLVFIRLVGATLLVSWLGAWLDSMIDRSIAWPGTSLPRCECTFLPWPYLGADVHRFAACDEGFWMWYMCGMLFLRTWKHKFEDLAFDYRQHVTKLTFGQAGSIRATVVRLNDRGVDGWVWTSLHRFNRTFLSWPYNLFFVWKRVWV